VRLGHHASTRIQGQWIIPEKKLVERVLLRREKVKELGSKLEVQRNKRVEER
jgi:hypothetical protein